MNDPTPSHPVHSAQPGAQQPLGGLSHVRGATTPPLDERTIGRLLADTVAVHGDREAAIFVEAGVRWTWSELFAESAQLAASLLASGIEPGDRVGIWSPNRPEWVLTQFATARIGAILVNINPAYRTAELEYALNLVGVKLLVCAERLKGSDYLQMLRSLAPELATCAPGELAAPRLPSLRSVVHLGSTPVPGAETFGELMRKGGPAQRQRLAMLDGQLSCRDAINIQFTSGTTGSPKGATLTHHNILNNARFVGHAMRLTSTDKLCIPVPLYHCFGMVMGVLACTAAGATMVFPGESFDPSATLGALAREACTAVHGVPTMFIAMLDAPDFARHDLSRMRTGVMAGAPCPVEAMKRVMHDMHMPEVTIAYGMTETSPVSFQSATDDPVDIRIGTVGRVQPHLEVKLADEWGQAVPLGATGEVWTRGYSVMRGYWNDEARTREVVADGWMRTGDLATMDARGCCNIVGRLKDMVIRGGENIYPREIEEFLYRMPGVSQVQVFGVPDPRYGEELACWIVLQPGASVDEAQVRDFCSGQIAHYKVPRHLRFVTSIPMTVTGKPQKFLMREAMVKELGLTAVKTA